MIYTFEYCKTVKPLEIVKNDLAELLYFHVNVVSKVRLG